MSNITKEQLYNFVKADDTSQLSTYDIWKELGNEGDAQDFINSLKGKSAYELWLEIEGNTGKSEEEFLESISKTYDIGGEELGLVKNGGNVVIEEDGTMTAPGTDLPLQSGEGNNSVVICNGNNKATGDFSISFGAENMSGCFAYTIIGVDKDNKTYTLDCADGLEVGDIYSANVNYIDKTTTMEENYGQITSIDGNVVSVDNLHCSKDFEAVENFFDDYGIDLEKNIFFILEKPMIGNRKIGFQSQTQGFDNVAFGHISYAEGAYNKALNAVTHAEGRNNTNTGYGSHTEGAYNKASGIFSHAEGSYNNVLNDITHAEGRNNTNTGYGSHTEGAYNKASGQYSHAEGYNTEASGTCSHTEGDNTEASGNYSHAEGYNTKASGKCSHAEGTSSASGQYSHAEGGGSASGHYSHAEGGGTKATGSYAHAEGKNTTGSGDGSHAEGLTTEASGHYSHAEGCASHAYGLYSHAEGYYAEAASELCSHAEGYNTRASGDGSHAEGRKTEASGHYSHAEGCSTEASGWSSHAEGGSTAATNACSHAEGDNTVARGINSHAEGYYTVASEDCTHVQGKCNIVDNEDRYAHIVGNGTNDTNRSNAHTLDWQGNAWYQGSMTSNGADYAEFFEWQDGNPDNEDRVGLLVTLDGEKIRLANEEDEVLGIISGTAAVLGDNYECEWNGKYLTDDFGRVIYDLVEEFVDVEHIEFKEVEKEIIDEETNETRIEIELEEVKTVEKQSLGFWKHPRLNPDYDSEQTYVNRSDRPEWDTVGMLGKLYVRDDGTCEVNGYATVGENGVATKSDEKTNIRVLSRANENVIRVLLK